MSTGSFLPIALRKISARPYEHPVICRTRDITCSWYTNTPYVSSRYNFSSENRYVIGSLPDFLSTRCLTIVLPSIIASNGPGLYIASPAEIHMKSAISSPRFFSMNVNFDSSRSAYLGTSYPPISRSSIIWVNPVPSIWKIPAVSPSLIIFIASASSYGILYRSKSGSYHFLTSISASWLTSTVRNPSTSILRYPIASRYLASYWHATDPLPPFLNSGTLVSSCTGATTTPAACVDSCFCMPSSLSIIFSAFSQVHDDLITISHDGITPVNTIITLSLCSLVILLFSSIALTLALVTVTVVSGKSIFLIAVINLSSSNKSDNSTIGSSGIVFLISLITTLGTHAACSTSSNTVFLLNVPYVMICAICSAPYFSAMYAMPICLYFWLISKSISGYAIRSGLRNRSKNRPNNNGSHCVIPRQ